MVSRMACMATTCTKSPGFPANSRQGAHFAEHMHQASFLQEREAAKALFLTPENLPTALATTISQTVSNQSSKTSITIDEPKLAPPTVKAGRLMSKEDAEKVKAAIARATTIEEIRSVLCTFIHLPFTPHRKLERSLRDGYMPEMESVGA